MLWERGKYVEGMTKDGWKMHDVPDEGGGEVVRKKVHFDELDMSLVLSSEPDFKAEKSQLQLFIEARGHVCDFLPKYHCELSPIESKWGRSKFFIRCYCEYTIKGMMENIPISLGLKRLPDDSKYDAVNLYGSGFASPLQFTRKLFRKSRDFMRSYQQKGRGTKVERSVFKAKRRPAPSEFGESDSAVIAARSAEVVANAAPEPAQVPPIVPVPARPRRRGAGQMPSRFL